MNFNISKFTSKIHFPMKRFNTFYGLQSFKDCCLLSLTTLMPNSIFKNDHAKYCQDLKKVTNNDFNYTYALGRHALYVGLKALELPSGSEILIPAFTCVVVPNAILYSNLKPIYVDIQLPSYSFNLADLEKKLTPNTRVLYIQHTFGHFGPIDDLLKFALKNNLIIVEDCAHTISQKIKINNQDFFIGQLGHFAFYSTDHSKMFSTQLGGVLSTNNKNFAQKIESINSSIPDMKRKTENAIVKNLVLETILLNPYFFWIGELILSILGKFKFIYHFNNELKVNYLEVENYPLKLGNKLSFLGSIQIKMLSENLKIRIKNVKYLNEFFNPNALHIEGPLLRYSLLVSNQQELIQQLNPKIQLGVWFTSIFQGRESDFDQIGYKQGSCPNAEFIAKHIVNFPTQPRLQIKNIIGYIQKNKISFHFYKGK